MRAFVSYSLNNTEKYILSVLSMHLNEKGISVVSNYSNLNSAKASTTAQISGCQFFIGIIADKGQNSEKVLSEWRISKNQKIPGLLLIEEKIKVSQTILNSTTVIRFNRHDINPAVERVKSKITQASRVINKPVVTTQTNDSAALILGGLAILAILALVSKKD